MKTVNVSRTHREILVLLASLLLAGTGLGQENPPARAARISYLRGDVSFLPSGQNQWTEAALNFTVTTGDRIYADRDARAELEIGPYTIRLSSETDLTVTNLNDNIMQLGLNQGTLRVTVFRFQPGDNIEIDTPNGALTLLDQGTYRVDTDANGGGSVVLVNSGSLEINGGGVSRRVLAGEAVQLTGQGPVEVDSISLPSPDSFDEWSLERDQHLNSSASAQYVSPSTPGYDDLDDFGRWQQTADYGPIWFPVGVPVGWIPYRFGRWAWIDPWGWTWVEDEPWGFCPFHYGRWVYFGTAWGWLPGPIVPLPVYAPAFVAFLGGGSFSIGIGVGLVAWFPLGPGEPFFPWYHHSGEYLRVVNITNIRNVTNITNITNVTNIKNVHYAYRTLATTAVPSEVFRNGQPVTGHAVRVTPQQLAKAEVIPHPGVNPTPRATAPGKPVSRPSVRPQRLAAGGPSSRPRGPSEIERPAPPAGKKSAPSPERRSASEPTARTLPPPGTHVPIPRTSPLIARTPPPPPPVPFVQRRQALMDHPGRPLDPVQLDHLREGRPVGPVVDREFPPHIGPVVREAPPPHPPAREARPKP
jgi:hypothetical protein